MDTIEIIKEYVRLRRRQAALSDEHDTVKQAANELEQQLLDFFAQQGMDRITVDGVTVYLYTQSFASVAEGYDSRDVAKALQAAGLGHMVTERYNANTLSAFVRELEREEEPLPPELEGKVSVARRYSLRTRQSD